MKWNLRSILILFLILALSFGFGAAYNGVATAVERHRYPIVEDYAALISENAAAFGVPETVLWAITRAESDFVSNKKGEDGSIGLMQISPDEMETICSLALGEPAPESGLLYDPATNLRLGAAWLSYLYRVFGTWEPVFAAWRAGLEPVRGWMSDPACLNEQGRLVHIPDKATARFVSSAQRAVSLYTSLYYEL